MDFFEAVEKRKSVRKFKAKNVPIEDLKKMIDCARIAPSALNTQPWNFVVIQNSEKKKKTRELYEGGRLKLGLYKQDTSFIENVSLVLVCSKPLNAWHVFSTALAIENLVLAATAMGYGSLIMTSAVSTDEQKSFFRKECNVPKELELLALIAIGFSDEVPIPKEKKKLEDILHLEKFV